MRVVIEVLMHTTGHNLALHLVMLLSATYQNIVGTQSSGLRIPLHGSPMSSDEITLNGDWIDQDVFNNQSIYSLV